MYLLTRDRSAGPLDARTHGVNRFVANGYSTDLTDATLTVRLRGTMDLAGPLCNRHVPEPRPDLGGAQLLLLVQAHIDGRPGMTANFVLTGQPLRITPEWSEQAVQLTPDPDQWTCLGTRHDLTDLYGDADIGDVLRDVDVDIIFVLFPLTIVPIGDAEDIHRQWAGRDYKVDMQYLPKGLVMFDTVQIEYPE